MAAGNGHTHTYPAEPPSSASAGAKDRRPGSVAIATEAILVERGLIELVRELPELRFAGCARSAEAIPSLLADQRPDVLILDAKLLGQFDCVRTLTITHRPRLLLLSHRRYAGINAERLQACACGMVHRVSSVDDIAAILRILSHCDLKRPASPGCDSCPARHPMRRPALPLSSRERDVFERIGRDESNLIIAAKLGVSVKTVETHRENIKTKLGLHSGHALVSAAIAWCDGELDLAALNAAAHARIRVLPG